MVICKRLEFYNYIRYAPVILVVAPTRVQSECTFTVKAVFRRLSNASSDRVQPRKAVFVGHKMVGWQALKSTSYSAAPAKTARGRPVTLTARSVGQLAPHSSHHPNRPLPWRKAASNPEAVNQRPASVLGRFLPSLLLERNDVVQAA